MTRFGQWLARLPKHRSPAPAPETGYPDEYPAEDVPDDSPIVGARSITKKTDFAFDLDVSRLERDAKEQALAWAKAGLPRANVADEALPVELALETRCVEVFRKWVDRVRVRFEDAVQQAVREAGGKLHEFRGRLAELEAVNRSAAETEREIREVRLASRGEAARLGFRSFMGRRAYWVLIVVLVCVDWVANVPVFGELLPREPGADQAWAELVARSEKYGLLGGLYRVAARTLFAPDVALLALGVIAFLVFLAHVSGESLRQRVSLREEDAPAARLGIRAHRRQFLLPAVLGGVGALLVVGVLFMARERVRDATVDRLRESEAQVERLETALAAARESDDLDAIGRISRQLPEARDVVEERAERAEYAAGIQAMNWPIFFLNLVLVIAAALAAYLAKDESVVEERLRDARLLDLQAELLRLRAEARQHRDALRGIGQEVQDRLGLAHGLLHARPLRGWEGKARRLHGVVSLFRAENARDRAIDPANILAFQRPVILDLPVLDPEEVSPTPPELLRLQEEFERFETELGAVGAAPDPVPADEAEREKAVSTSALMVLAAASIGLAGCAGEGSAQGSAPAREPRQVIVAIDLSGSRTPRMFEQAKAILDQVIDDLDFGDQIVLLEMHQASAHDSVRQWADSVPALPDPEFVSSRDENRRAGVRAGAHAVAREFFDPGVAGLAQRTDILSTLHVAAEYVRDAAHRRPTLILLSDMLQSANGLEMEGLRRMPGPDWIARQEAAGVLPRLDGACIAVVGADPSTEEGSEVRDFWIDYFSAVGARLPVSNYRILATRASGLACAA